MYFDDIEYAKKRLEGTLVRKSNGNPFHIATVELVGGQTFCIGSDFATGQSESVNLREIDLTPVPLGFVNLPGGNAVFTCRKPMRRDWKQGLSPNSIVVYGGEGRLNNFKPLIQPILKQYPNFATAVTNLSKRKSCAFSRDFAVERSDTGISLKYRKYVVGSIDNGRPVLDPNYFFLDQHLAASIG